MKKILIILLFFSFIGCKAKDYYSEYGPFSDWTTEFIELSDTVDIESSKRYKYYVIKEEGNYFIENMNPKEYPLINKELFYYTDFSGYSLLEPESFKNREINQMILYKYKNKNLVRFIKLTNIHGGYGTLRISEISITSDTDINYKYTCFGCSTGFKDNINNKVKNENLSNISNEGELIIDLGSDYRYEDLNISISIYDVTSDTKTFNIEFYNKENILIMSKNIAENFRCNGLNNYKEYIFNYNNLNHMNLYETDTYEDDKLPDDVYLVSSQTYYSYRDLYYYYYKEILEYSDYLSEAIAYYPYKTDDYKYYYRYRTRAKVSVEDDIIITDKNYNLYDYVESEEDVFIEDNINIDQNGDYMISIQTPFNIIEKTVTVSLEENTLREELEKLKEEYETLLQEYGEIQLIKTNYENIINDLENINKDNIKTIEDNYKSYKDEIDKITKELDSTKDENAKLKEDINLLIDKNLSLQKELDDLNIKTYNENIETINNYKNRISELSKEIDNYEFNLENIKDENYKNIKKYENEIINLRLDKKEEVSYSYYYIPAITLVLLIILFILKKKKN